MNEIQFLRAILFGTLAIYLIAIGGCVVIAIRYVMSNPGRAANRPAAAGGGVSASPRPTADRRPLRSGFLRSGFLRYREDEVARRAETGDLP